HAAIAGVGAAIDYVASWGRGEDLRCRIVSAMRDIAAWEERLARRYAARVAAVPGVRVWGPPFGDGERAPTVSITVDGIGATDAARELGRAGIFVWDGHFYAARALEVLGIAERGLLRAGVLMYSTEEEVDRLAKGVERLACR
ncbi:MAG TPA: aminotransferase class V-fold PLP-dependent enzyme, partial [Thermoanaerobaculia bacterium]|nr:aminotransferase class V-fold PLP-dependent enzyme [Thermoanaerobaculia bacterium]